MTNQKSLNIPWQRALNSRANKDGIDGCEPIATKLNITSMQIGKAE